MATQSPGSQPAASSAQALARMQRQRRTDTRPESELRRRLHRRGLRYLVDAPLPLPGLRRRADVLFRGALVAVFVDGCYWHACPIHGTTPKTNREWWASKLALNVARDRDTDQRLADAGWLAVRVWEHDEPDAAADLIERIVRRRSQSPSCASSMASSTT